MRTNACCAMLLGLLLACGSATSWALEFELMDEEVTGLNNEAKTAYDEALKRLNHINYDAALDSLIKAQEADTKHIGIRFLVGKLAKSLLVP